MAEHTLSHVKESQRALDELIAKHAQDVRKQMPALIPASMPIIGPDPKH
jgi:hypothetical protein